MSRQGEGETEFIVYFQGTQPLSWKQDSSWNIDSNIGIPLIYELTTRGDDKVRFPIANQQTVVMALLSF